jgi:hypothetical protein
MPASYGVRERPQGDQRKKNMALAAADAAAGLAQANADADADADAKAKEAAAAAPLCMHHKHIDQLTRTQSRHAQRGARAPPQKPNRTKRDGTGD